MYTRTKRTLLALVLHYLVWCCHTLECSAANPIFCNSALREERTPDGQAAGIVEAEYKTRSSFHRRHLLDTVDPQLNQDVNYSYYGIFHESFNHFADSNLVDYTLLPLNGSCSSGAILPAAVTDCAAQHNCCCFNASNFQVRCCAYLPYQQSCVC